MKYGKIIVKGLILAALFDFSLVTAQNQKTISSKQSTQFSIEHIKAAYSDSLNQAVNKFQNHWKYEKTDTLANPYYFQLFSPLYVYSSAIDRTFQWPEHNKFESDVFATPLNQINNVLLSTYTDEPTLFNIVERNDSKHDNLLRPKVDPASPLLEKRDASVGLDRSNEQSFNEPLDITVFKPNFWTFKPNFSLQFMQTYVSSNWYKGGDSHNSLIGTFNIDANYNNKRKIIFDNRLETKLGFQSSRDDDEHKYKTNSDLLRLTNKLGLKAATNWYYTLLLQSWTQFYPGYRSNDKFVYSDFMSPFESVFSIGMDYKLSKKKFNITITMAPLACDFVYVDRKALETRFGLRPNHHSKFDYGSNLTATYSWNIWTGIQWSGRIYYFTDYKRVQAEWENTFNLTINKYLSTKLFLYPRFDDGAKRKKENDSYFQFSEWLSLGLNLSF